MRTQVILFIAALIAATAFLTIGYIFGTVLQPTLPLFPAACGLLAIISAMQAGIIWERISDE